MPSRAGKRRHNRHWERLEAPGRGARAAAYLRYSSDMQSPHTITVQRRMCLEYAAKQGWRIVVWYEEPATTAKCEEIEERPCFAELLEVVKRHEVDVVLCAQNDRWARNEAVTYMSIAIIRRAGVWWATADGRWDINKIGDHGWDVAYAVDTTLNAAYSRRLSEKTVNGKEERARQGWHVGDVPFGYLPPQYPKAPDDGTASWRPPRMPIVPDPKNWPALQLIADLRCKKWSAREIAEELNAIGYRTSGRKRVGPKHARTGDHLYTGTRLFNADNVRAILNNPLYAAYEPGCEYGTIITPSGLRVKGQHKGAWDYSTWQRMQQVAEELYLAPHSTAVSRAIYPLAGVITCIVCGEAMRSWHTHRKGREYRYYTCWSRKRGLSCTAQPGSTPAEVVENSFGFLLVAHQLDADWCADLTTMLDMTDQDDYWERIEAERRRLRVELDRVNTMFRYGSIDEDQFATDIASIQQQLSSLPKRDDQERYKTRAIEAGETLVTFAESWRDASVQKQGEIVRFLLQRGGLAWDHETRRIVGLHPFREFLPGLTLALMPNGWHEVIGWLWATGIEKPFWLA